MGERFLLRDFVYLDFERVRSYVAQLFGGIMESRKAKEELSGETKIEGSLGPKALGSIGGSTSLFFQRGAEETKSLHHNLYNLFEEELFRLGKICGVDYDKYPNGWEEGDFGETDFVLIKGPVQIYDYENFINKLSIFPDLVDAINNVIRFSLQKKREDGEINDVEFRTLSKTEKIEGFKRKDIDSITKIVENLYSGTMRFKVFINEGLPEYFFVGMLENKWLQSEIPIGERFKARSSMDWEVLAQINYTKEIPPIKAGNGESILDKLEEVLFVLGELHQTFVSVSYPAVSVTPIAIYREC